MRFSTATKHCGILCAFSLLAFAQADEPTSKPKPLFRDFMGVNGHTVSFKPDLYSPVCRLVRDYHPMEWDTGPDSDYKLDFPFARNRVNWDQVYGSWQRAGFTTDACIMFETISPDKWKDVRHDSNRYGKLFAQNFGPSSNLALVESIEIGNEPGKYSDDAYRELFESMAKGIREGDPKLQIATCNVNVGKSGDYHKSIDCVSGLESLYDVLNVHTYAMLEQWPTWKRSYPEDPDLPAFTHDVDELIRWRDENAADKLVWITEFGWDSSTKSPAAEGDFAKWQGNSDLEQAQWLVRSFFLFASRDIDRAYIYFFNDEDSPQLHGSSGLTRSFKPKPSYYAVSHLFQTLGDYRYSKVVHQSTDAGGVRVCEFSHESNPNDVVWVAWLPSGSQRQSEVQIPSRGWKLRSAELMPIDMSNDNAVNVSQENGQLRMQVSESPTYCFMRRE